ncbi:MAG: hypothetical protein CMH78_05320 [Nitrospinae bacterium]|jgi:hypothetical protein|nr:hypothetical protein [Nitrospinota bacterium]
MNLPQRRRGHKRKSSISRVKAEQLIELFCLYSAVFLVAKKNQKKRRSPEIPVLRQREKTTPLKFKIKV